MRAAGGWRTPARPGAAAGQLQCLVRRRPLGKNVPCMNDKVRAALQDLGIPYEVVLIDPAYSATVMFCEKYGYSLEQTCNTIIVLGKGATNKLAACVVAGAARLDVNNRVRKLLGVRKASFAPAELMREATGMEVDGVTPIGLPKWMPLYVDERLATYDWVMLGAGTRDAKIKVSPRVFSALGAERVTGLSST